MGMNKRGMPKPPSELLDLATAYQRSRVLFALVEFGLPTMLVGAAQSSEEIARRLQIHPRAADRLLHVGVALGLLEQEEGRFRNARLADEFLIKGKQSYLGEQILLYGRASYPLWRELVPKLREWQPDETPDETEAGMPQEEGQSAESLSAMHNLALLTGRALSLAYDFSRHQKMLDLGGGTGAMSIGVCERHPQLRAVVFDLPQIIDLAREFIRESGLSKRIETRAGNFTFVICLRHHDKQAAVVDFFDLIGQWVAGSRAALDPFAPVSARLVEQFLRVLRDYFVERAGGVKVLAIANQYQNVC
jgi:hypothetical protein